MRRTLVVALAVIVCTWLDVCCALPIWAATPAPVNGGETDDERVAEALDALNQHQDCDAALNALHGVSAQGQSSLRWLVLEGRAHECKGDLADLEEARYYFRIVVSRSQDPDTEKEIADVNYQIHRLKNGGSTQKDQAGAAAVASPVPTPVAATSSSRLAGTALIRSGQAAQQRQDYATALNDFDQAAAAGDPQIAAIADILAGFTCLQKSPADYRLAQTYAERALAIDPNDDRASFLKGVSLGFQWAPTRDDSIKQEAIAALAMAYRSAKAKGDDQLSLQIQAFATKELGVDISAQP